MKKTIRNDYALKYRNIYFFYFIIIFLIYSPVYLFTYIFSDDWSTVIDVITGGKGPLEWDMKSGRPFYAVARYYAVEMMQGINDFSYLRVVCVLTISLLAGFLYRFINRREIFEDYIMRITFPLLICFIPSIQVYAAWATCFPFVLSLLLAGLSYATLVNKEGIINARKVPASLLLLWLAFAIYQPTAMAFLFYVMLDNCIRKKSINYNRLLVCALVMAAGMLGSLVMSKYLPIWIYGKGLGRDQFAPSIADKFFWFINEPLLNVVNNYNIDPVLPYTIFSSIIILIGLLMLLKEKQGVNKIFWSLFWRSVAIPLTY